MKNCIAFILIGVLGACQPAKKEEVAQLEIKMPTRLARHSASIDKIFKAHGGFEIWSGMKQLDFTKGDERHTIGLKTRESVISSPNRTIGFDGQEVWVAPAAAKIDGARFYHNLYFYFYAMPFVLGDPGVFYEDLAERNILGTPYAGVKISYDDGVGDSPKDNYIVWYDKDTNKMEWLMYTVTYRSGETSEEYHLIKYSQWENFDGLTLPKVLQWYEFENDSVGNMRNEVVFDSISISKEQPAKHLFTRAEDAQIAPLFVRE